MYRHQRWGSGATAKLNEASFSIIVYDVSVGLHSTAYMIIMME